MRALTVLCLSVLFACAGAQRPASDSPFNRVSTTLSDLQVQKIWRIRFEVSKAWVMKAPPEAKDIAFTSADRDAMLFVAIDLGEAGSTATSVAERACRTVIASIAGEGSELPKIEVLGDGHEAWFALSGAMPDGRPIVLQGRVRAMKSGGSVSWLVLIAMGGAKQGSLVSSDLAHIASTADSEPISTW